MMWTVLSVVLSAGAIVLVLVGQWLPATVLVLAAVVVGVVGGRRAKARREADFRARFHSVERIRETHDLSGFHRIRDESGEVAAVRAVRKEFPGISLTDAAALVRA
jgi:CHASE2 domain-containing sensor protein